MAPELKHRRKLAVAAKDRVAKKKMSTPDPPPMSSARRRPFGKRVLPPAGPSSSSSSSSSPSVDSVELIRVGTYVHVSILSFRVCRPQKRVTLVDRAVVASAAEDGFVEVFFPWRVRRFEVVRVPTHEITGLVPPPPSSTGCEFVSVGAQVRVRQPPTKLEGGMRVVFVHKAVLVSAAEDGFVHVFYHDDVPIHVQPFRITRVSTDQIKQDV